MIYSGIAVFMDTCINVYERGRGICFILYVLHV